MAATALSLCSSPSSHTCFSTSSAKTCLLTRSHAVTVGLPRAVGDVTKWRKGAWKVLTPRSMAPDDEKMTRRSPLDFPVEWERPTPGRRPDIFPQFSPMKTPLPQPLPTDPPEEDEDEDEKKEDDPDKEPDKPAEE